MILLDTVNKSLEVLLAGAVTTTELDFVVAYADHSPSAFVPASSDGVTNGAVAVTMIAAPAASTQRQVKFVSIYNGDTVAATVTVQVNNNATLRVVVKIVLAVGSTLVYVDGRGFYVIDSAGLIL